MTLRRVVDIHSHGSSSDHVSLTYDQRFLRRKRLQSDGGTDFLIDLPSAVSLDDGVYLELDDGSSIRVIAADEPLLEVRGDLVRLAWHIGNRHTPCQISAQCLRIRNDPVLADMLRHLGAEVSETLGAFVPEGGAYGHGRTFGHSHGAEEHAAASAHSHSHDHP